MNDEILGIIVVAGFVIVICIYSYIQENKQTRKELKQFKEENCNLRKQLYDKDNTISAIKNDAKQFRVNLEEKYRNYIVADYQARKKLEEKYSSKDIEYQQKDICYNKIKQIAEELKNKLDTGLETVAQLSTDYGFVLSFFDWLADYNDFKKCKSVKEAEKIRKNKAIVRQAIQETKLTQYRYEVLFRKFPKLKKIYNDILQEVKSAVNRIDINKDLILFKYEVLFNIFPELLDNRNNKEIKAIVNQAIKEKDDIKTGFEIIFTLYPELGIYKDSLQELRDTLPDSLADFQDDFDRGSFYLTEEEYKKLSITERNQLALERYINGNKTDWQIGRDYELFIGQQYESKGYKVKYFGIEKKFEDLGRDIIAENDNEILIIQCKNWSQNKEIHEKHISQLYGTAVKYSLENKTFFKNIKPVIVTTTALSEKAKEFAKYLKVDIIENKKFKEFSRIKCNIGKNGEKIYHLPFDQQYDRVIIEKEKGEFFTKTVKEAEEKGFRRAKKFYGIDKMK